MSQATPFCTHTEQLHMGGTDGQRSQGAVVDHRRRWFAVCALAWVALLPLNW